MNAYIYKKVFYVFFNIKNKLKYFFLLRHAGNVSSMHTHIIKRNLRWGISFWRELVPK